MTINLTFKVTPPDGSVTVANQLINEIKRTSAADVLNIEVEDVRRIDSKYVNIQNVGDNSVCYNQQKGDELA